MLTNTVDLIEQNLFAFTSVKHAVLLVTHDSGSMQLHLHGNVSKAATIEFLEGALELARSLSNENDKSLN